MTVCGRTIDSVWKNFLTFETDQFLFLACARQKNHVPFTGKCMLYSLCQLPPPPILHAFPF
jgi:hypothetical protein